LLCSHEDFDGFNFAARDKTLDPIQAKLLFQKFIDGFDSDFIVRDGSVDFIVIHHMKLVRDVLEEIHGSRSINHATSASTASKFVVKSLNVSRLYGIMNQTGRTLQDFELWMQEYYELMEFAASNYGLLDETNVSVFIFFLHFSFIIYD